MRMRMRCFTLHRSNWNRRRLACVMFHEAVVIRLFDYGSQCTRINSLDI